jgi:uncharacterized protein
LDGETMTAATAQPLGLPYWVDLSTPDQDTAKRFYRELLSWHDYTLAVPGYGGYTIFTLEDEQGPAVAGMSQIVDDSRPPSWTCYFEVADLQTTIDAVTAEGGQEMVPPTAFNGTSQIALCQDTQGGDFGIMPAGNPVSFGSASGPSTMCRVELACRDVEEGRRFYCAVFDWKAVNHGRHSTFTAGDRTFGGIVSPSDARRRHAPSQWIPYFWVLDCDETAARAESLGAEVVVAPTDIEPGRHAILTGPTGARLAVITPTPALGTAR